MRTVYLNAAYFPAVELLSAVATGVILLYGGYQVLDGNMKIGVLVAFVGYLQSFFDPIQQLSNLYSTYQQGAAALEKIFSLLDTEPDMGPARCSKVGRCAARSSSRTCRSRTGTLWRTMETGQRSGPCGTSTSRCPRSRTLALVGETGAEQVDAREAGRAVLQTRSEESSGSTATTSARSLRRAFAGSSASCRRKGSCSAEPCGTTSRSAGRGNRRRDRGAARMGAHDFILRLQEGYENDVGERGSRLSAGQRQLGARARADRRPRILILDEATANVDVHAEAAIETGPAPAARRAHGDRHCPPAFNGAQRRPDRGAGERRDRRDRHARRADRSRRLLSRSTASGRMWPRRSFRLAAGQGLEPRFSGPEPDVLPLDDPAIERQGEDSDEFDSVRCVVLTPIGVSTPQWSHGARWSSAQRPVAPPAAGRLLSAERRRLPARVVHGAAVAVVPDRDIDVGRTLCDEDRCGASTKHLHLLGTGGRTGREPFRRILGLKLGRGPRRRCRRSRPIRS